MSETEAATYRACYEILVNRAKPEREALQGRNASASSRAKLWWRFSREAKELYEAIEGIKRVLVIARVSRTCAFVFVKPDQVLNDKLIVFAIDNYADFAVLQSSLHYCWCWTYASTLKGDLNYSQTDCFETFPFPDHYRDALEDHAESYHSHRRHVMLSRQEGLTKSSNRFHNPDETSADIHKLRQLHVEMDNAVAAAYGWTDLDLGHGFHETKQGVRYTISEPARREVLARLLKLNHERYAEEVKQGLHEKKKPKPSKKKAKADGGMTMFGEE